jgi:hypothetical protein
LVIKPSLPDWMILAECTTTGEDLIWAGEQADRPVTGYLLYQEHAEFRFASRTIQRPFEFHVFFACLGLGLD